MYYIKVSLPSICLDPGMEPIVFIHISQLVIYLIESMNARCSEEEWECKDGKRCIPKDCVCDINIHCRDGSDESDDVCADWQCAEGLWKCANNKCINSIKVCDGSTLRNDVIKNCLDESDEDSELCMNWDCGEGMRKCDNRCIATKYLCNGWIYCSDSASDYNEFCSTWNCVEGMHKCAHGTACIDRNYICDGWISCSDESDELHCNEYDCPEGFWKCRDNSSCIDANYVCNFRTVHYQCSDNSDKSPEVCKTWTCPPGFWECKDGDVQCIKETNILDGGDDCTDGSDENPQYHPGRHCAEGYYLCEEISRCMNKKVMCVGKILETGMYPCNNKTFCRDWECPPENWPCADDMQCIPVEHVCDGNEHATSTFTTVVGCDDFSDEHTRLCGCKSGWGEDTAKDSWPCVDGYSCVGNSVVCDGIAHCNDGSDESWIETCYNWNCTADKWKCLDNRLCIPQREVCNGKIQCQDGSDEAQCSKYQCMEGFTKCADGVQCISWYAVCDDKIDCNDASDELCAASCLENELDPPTIIRKCEEDSAICIPAERYCDGLAQCPQGSDEKGCSCIDWNMFNFQIQQKDYCIYSEWMTYIDPSVDPCIDLDNGNGSSLGKRNCTAFVTVSVDGKDELTCLSGRSQKHCKSIAYAIQGEAKKIFLQGFISNHSGNISIGCEELACDIFILGYNGSLDRFILSIINHGVNGKISVRFQNITLSNGVVLLNGIAVIFENAEMSNIIIKDDRGNPSKRNHVQVAIIKSIYICDNSVQCGIFMNVDSVLRLTIFKTMVKESNLSLFLVSDLYMVISESLFFQSYINIKTKSFLAVPTIITLQHCLFNNLDATGFKSGLMIQAHNPYVTTDNCTFHNFQVSFISIKQHYQENMLYFFTKGSNFLKCLTEGNGGAVKIASGIENSYVAFSHCSFIENSAIQDYNELSGQGGAVSIEAILLQFVAEGCKFLDNYADLSGTSIYASKGVYAAVINCTFAYDIRTNDPLSPILNVAGKMSNLSGWFKVKNSNPNSYTTNIPLLQTVEVKNVDIEVECPSWHRYSPEYNKVSKSYAIEQFRYGCQTCPDGYYIVPIGKSSFLYSSKGETDIVRSNVGVNNCLKCPYGAQCSGNNVVPRPNYWGFLYGNKLKFYQCPPEYCCSGVEQDPCNTYDHCSGSRTGLLCGACLEGFSVSILAGKCTPDKNCGNDQWFWFLTLILTMIYAIWYTFKGNLFALFSKCWKGRQSKAPQKVRRLKVNSVGQDSIGKQNAMPIANVNPKQVSKGKLPKQEKPSTSTERNKKNPENGYFGIVTYFVQMAAVMKIQIEFSDVHKSEPFLDKLLNTIGTFLDIEPDNISIDACPIKGLVTKYKHTYKLVFLLGVYVSWSLLFLGYYLLRAIRKHGTTAKETNDKMLRIKCKLIQGIIEIVKYTYSGICTVIFMSLVCVQIGSNYVWWYDATNTCLQTWQTVMVILALVYALPFPVALFFGMKMLRGNQISARKFIICCIFPPLSIFLAIKYHNKKAKRNLSNQMPRESMAIIEKLQGPYREGDEQMTLYWEAMVSTWRLLITAMTLVGFASIRMVFITAFCILFAIQNVYMAPFQVKHSNHVETFSLFLLSIVAVINLMKALLTDAGVVPSGPSVSFFKGTEFTEKILILFLFIFIVGIELNRKHDKKVK